MLIETEVDLAPDVRWQLIERIVLTEPFQKSTRLPALLRYLAQCTIAGDQEGLTEQKIGKAVFGKPANYTPAEDSSVRVHVRQLRLRLHEYYGSEGRNEPVVVEIPKGRYAVLFHSAIRSAASETRPLELIRPLPALRGDAIKRTFPWLAVALAIACAAGWYRSSVSNRPVMPPWPLSMVIQDHVQTTVVLADIGYALRMLGDKEVPLGQYVDRSYLRAVIPQKMDAGETRLIQYMEASQSTSVADAHAATTFAKLAGSNADNLIVRSARDLNSHDLDHCNYIFVGAKTSNPWVELFEDRLNFRFVEDSPGGPRYILNRNPQPGEQATYNATGPTGSSGEDFATIAVLPSKNGTGNILLIQGLRLEGTEASIRLLDNEATRASLMKRLAAANKQEVPKYFEALLHAQSVAGAPVSIDFLAVRVIQP
jgi:hypothetical protein